MHGNKKRSNIDINLQGVAIGNGMSSPKIQYNHYADYSLSHGLISLSVKEQVDAQYKLCVAALNSPAMSANASDICNNVPGIIENVAGNFNVYDVSKTCDGPLCYNS